MIHFSNYSSLISEFDFVALMPFAIFAAIAIGAWVVVDIFFNGKTKTESRLDQMRDRASSKSDLMGAGSSTKQGIAKMLENASPKFADALKPKSEKEITAMKQKLDEAGFRGENASQMLTTIKVFAAAIGFFMGGGVGLITTGFGIWPMLYALMTGAVFMFAPEIILGFIGGSRKQNLFLGLPDALDLMVVCVEAGLGMDQALRRVADELEESHPVVAEEFQVCNRQLQMGSTRETVLTELGERNGVDDLKTLSAVMIQVDKFGTSVGKALRVQSEAMRTRRRQIAEEKAAKTAVKLIFPLVLFIFPGIFVVLVGPAAITMVNEMLPMMSGK